MGSAALLGGVCGGIGVIDGPHIPVSGLLSYLWWVAQALGGMPSKTKQLL
jgi:hypothetical protein